MIGAPGFNIVHQTVARNPVARAIARQRIEAGVRDFSIRLHLLAEREYVAADGMAAARVLMVAHEVLAQHDQASSPAARVIFGAISALRQLAERHWLWRRLDANAIDAGLDHAAEVAKTATAVDLQRAWAKVDRLDALSALAASAPGTGQGPQA